MKGSLVNGWIIAVGWFVVSAAWTKHARYCQKIFIQHLSHHFIELTQKTTVYLERFHVLLSVFFYKIALGEDCIILATIKEENILILFEYSEIYLQLFLTALENTGKARTKPPTSYSLLENIRKASLWFFSIFSIVWFQVFLDIFEDVDDMFGEVRIILVSEQKMVFEPTDADHAFYLTHFLIFLSNIRFELIVAAGDGGAILDLHGQMKEEQLREAKMHVFSLIEEEIQIFDGL